VANSSIRNRAMGGAMGGAAILRRLSGIDTKGTLHGSVFMILIDDIARAISCSIVEYPISVSTSQDLLVFFTVRYL
jgi:hypothetical protein